MSERTPSGVPTPRDMALAEHEAWTETPEGQRAMIRLRYLGADLEPVLAPLRERNARYVERILSVPPAPEPAYARPADDTSIRVQREEARRMYDIPQARRPRSRREASSLMGVEGAGRVRQTRAQQAMFAEWVEGQRQWSPAVMGWEDADPRAEGYEDGRYDG